VLPGDFAVCVVNIYGDLHLIHHYPSLIWTLDSTKQFKLVRCGEVSQLCQTVVTVSGSVVEGTQRTRLHKRFVSCNHFHSVQYWYWYSASVWYIYGSYRKIKNGVPLFWNTLQEISARLLNPSDPVAMVTNFSHVTTKIQHL